jgi:hypothetical protein
MDRTEIQSRYEKIAKAIPEFGQRHSFNEFLQTAYVLSSRFFSLNKYDPSKYYLVPYADLANTKGLKWKNADWKYDEMTNSFKFYATTKLEKGETVKLYVYFVR